MLVSQPGRTFRQSAWWSKQGMLPIHFLPWFLLGSLPWQSCRAIRLREHKHSVFTNPSAVLCCLHSCTAWTNQSALKAPMPHRVVSAKVTPFLTGLCLQYIICVAAWRMGTAESVLHPALNRVRVFGPQIFPFLNRAGLPDCCLVSAIVVLHSPISHPNWVICIQLLSPGGCAHYLWLCLLAGPPPHFSISLYLEGLSLPKAGLTCLISLMAETLCRFLKRLPLNNLYGCIVSKNQSHQMRWMQIPALHYPPGIVPIHAASFLKSRPLVP